MLLQRILNFDAVEENGKREDMERSAEKVYVVGEGERKQKELLEKSPNSQVSQPF